MYYEKITMLKLYAKKPNKMRGGCTLKKGWYTLGSYINLCCASYNTDFIIKVYN